MIFLEVGAGTGTLLMRIEHTSQQPRGVKAGLTVSSACREVGQADKQREEDRLKCKKTRGHLVPVPEFRPS